jgi:hypothetical protein
MMSLYDSMVSLYSSRVSLHNFREHVCMTKVQESIYDSKVSLSTHFEKHAI